MPRINSRQKGKRGEREAVTWLKSLGADDARRTQQYCGAEGTSDIVCPVTFPGLHIEIKFGYPAVKFHASSSLLYDACSQAEADALGRDWIVLWKPKGHRAWLATTRHLKTQLIVTAEVMSLDDIHALRDVRSSRNS